MILLYHNFWIPIPANSGFFSAWLWRKFVAKSGDLTYSNSSVWEWFNV
jgi:hypothetical protein